MSSRVLGRACVYLEHAQYVTASLVSSVWSGQGAQCFMTSWIPVLLLLQWFRFCSAFAPAVVLLLQCFCSCSAFAPDHRHHILDPSPFLLVFLLVPRPLITGLVRVVRARSAVFHDVLDPSPFAHRGSSFLGPSVSARRVSPFPLLPIRFDVLIVDFTCELRSR